MNLPTRTLWTSTARVERLRIPGKTDIHFCLYLPLTESLRSVVEATTSAIVSCLFKLLRTYADPEVLDPSMHIVCKAHALQASEIEIALYEGAKNFVQAWPTKSKRGGV